MTSIVGPVPIFEVESDDPHPPEFHQWKDRAIALFQQQDFPGAMAALDRAIEFCQIDQILGNLYARKAEIYLVTTGNMESVMEYSTKAIEYNPIEPSSYIMRSKVYEEQGEFIKAIDDIWQATIVVGEFEISPQIYELLTSAGVKTAKELIKNHREIRPLPTGTITTYFQTLVGDPIIDWINGKFPEVDVDRMESGDGDPRGFLGALNALHTKNFDKVIDFCTQEIDENPSTKFDIEAHYLRGSFRLFWSYSSGVVEDLEHVISSPDASDKFKVYALIRMGEFSEMFEEDGYKSWFEEAATLDENNVDVLYLTADNLADNGHYAEALEGFNKVVEIKPDHIVAWAVKYFMEIRLAQFVGACEEGMICLDLLDKLIHEHGQSNPDLIYLYGQMLKELSDSYSSYVYLDRAEKLLPKHPGILNSKTWILYELTGDYVTYLNRYYEMMENGIVDVGICESIANIECSIGHYEKALQAVENGLKYAYSREQYKNLCRLKHTIEFKQKINIIIPVEELSDALYQLVL